MMVATRYKGSAVRSKLAAEPSPRIAMMHRRTLTAVLGTIISGLFGLVGLDRRSALAAPAKTGMGGMDGMMSGGMGGMMADHNMMGPMKLGMELFERHAEIHRTTEYLPDGIIDATVSANPETARIIQAHVIEMYNRMAANRPFNYMMSPSASTMLQNPTRYRRSYRLLPTGIEVTETSDDPEMVKVIYAHAKELDRFAAEGMPAMMRGMMGKRM
ncbi:MAG TPA: hypothetical protein PK677_15010 [Acidiphilium sp.]|uniref:hypothetical protein n=1 Tax=Acidiphilium sp. 37-64-53 TaxID=1970299 RepID=UPI00257A67FF|nr:hypothetical protein [Acidiphilium sp. 37-64-53]HQT89830.1 hypothetical protein [Acidiphilium sp.]